MAKILGKFRITKTNDQEIMVEDMEKEEEKEVIDTGGETYDAAEIKEVSDMCKDMGFESIKDMAMAVKDMQKKIADMDKEDPDKTKTDDEDPEEEEEDGKKTTTDAAISEIEITIAGIKDVKVKDSLINLVSRVKDGLKGYERSDIDLSKDIFKAQAKDEELAKKQPDFSMDEFFGAHNPHKKGGH